MAVRIISRFALPAVRSVRINNKIISITNPNLTRKLHEPTNITEPPLPEPKLREGESTEVRRARLLYQSRKRGMAENGLLLSTFAGKYLAGLNNEQLVLYDKLINLPSNDWEIYYWMVGAQPTPPEYENEIMDMLKEHAKNTNMESRITQPSLY